MNLDHQGVFDEGENALLSEAYRMALHLVASRPAFFSGMPPRTIRERLASHILMDARAGEWGLARLSWSAVRSVELAIAASGRAH